MIEYVLNATREFAKEITLALHAQGLEETDSPEFSQENMPFLTELMEWLCWQNYEVSMVFQGDTPEDSVLSLKTHPSLDDRGLEVLLSMVSGKGFETATMTMRDLGYNSMAYETEIHVSVN